MGTIAAPKLATPALRIAEVGPIILVPGSVGRALGHCHRLRYIGSSEAASYRRLPPLEPSMASSRHVPLPVLRGPVSAPSVIDYRRRRLLEGQRSGFPRPRVGGSSVCLGIPSLERPNVRIP